MKEDNIVQLRAPGSFSEDPLTEVLRLGARQLLAHAVEAEVSAFVAGHADLLDGDGALGFWKDGEKLIKHAA